MRRRAAEQALSNRGLFERFANRWRGVFENASCPKFAVPFSESEIAAEARVSDDTTARYLSFSEIFMRLNRDEWRSHDFLGIVSIDGTDGLSKGDSPLLTYFIGPATLRNQSSVISAGVVMTDIPIGRVSGGSDAWELSAILYRVRNGSPAQKVLETIENLIPVIDYQSDLPGSLSVAESVLERVRFIAGSPEASAVVAGKFSTREKPQTNGATRYVAFLQPPSERDLMRRFFVKGGSFYVSQRTADSLRGEQWTSDTEPAIPTRFQDFALLRFGPKLETRGPTRSIHQLRRERAVGGSAFLEDVGKQEGRNYVDRDARLRKTRRLTAIFGSEGLHRLPAVTPIAIEIAADLIPLIESESSNLSREFQEVLGMMKDGLRYELGIEVPGVRVRGNVSGLPLGTYIIMLDEVPLVMGTARLGASLCNATKEELNSIGVTAESTTNPANGRADSWVKEEDYVRLRDRGREIRPEGLALWNTLEYIILHLSSVVRKNAADFLGVKAVADLIRTKHKAAYDSLCNAPGGLPRLTAVLRILLEEEVPIVELAAICSRYLALAASGMAAHAIADELRVLDAVRPSLVYRRDSVPVYQLGKDLVKLIREGIIEHGDAVVLALKPEPTQEALSAVRNEVSNLPPTAPNPVVLVEDWRLRRPFRKLVELEFPHLRVLSRRELADLAGSITTVGTIEMD